MNKVMKKMLTKKSARVMPLIAALVIMTDAAQLAGWNG